VFDDDSGLVITPADIGPISVVLEGIVGAGVSIAPEVRERPRPSEVSFKLAEHLLLLYVACTRMRAHLLRAGVTPTSEYPADFRA
jgi:hypothetical protein